MSKHTPGPWSMTTVPTAVGSCHKIGPFPNESAHVETYACVYADGQRLGIDDESKTSQELAANARLIASAPDLLSVSMIVMEWWEKHEYDCIGDRNIFDFEPDFVTAARAAIAKATGATAPATNPEAAAAFDKMIGSPKFPSVKGGA